MSLVSEADVDLQMSVADLPEDVAQEIVRLTNLEISKMQRAEVQRTAPLRREEQKHAHH